MPTKKGLDWFPFDVDLLDHPGLDFLRHTHGYIVNDIYIGLLTLLYRKEGYYIPYSTNKDKTECVWYLIKQLRGGKYPIKNEAITAVIEGLVACELFSGDHYPEIITSERAQETYYSATVDRKLESLDIQPKYWLLSDEKMRKLSKKHPYYLFLHPESNSPELDGKSPELDGKSPEIRADKIRGEIKKNINSTPNARACENVVIYEAIPPGLTDTEAATYEWKLMLNKLEQTVNSLGLDVWIRPLQPLGYDNSNRLVLKAPTTASKDEAYKYIGKISEARMRADNQ